MNTVDDFKNMELDTAVEKMLEGRSDMAELFQEMEQAKANYVASQKNQVAIEKIISDRLWHTKRAIIIDGKVVFALHAGIGLDPYIEIRDTE